MSHPTDTALVQWKPRPLKLIAGSGGGGKGGGSPSGSTAKEDPDTLVARQIARVIDVLSEGPIEGWTNPTFPLLDIALDGTPIQNNDAWAIQHDGRTVVNTVTFTNSGGGVAFPVYRNHKGIVKPTKSSIVGRWIWVKNSGGTIITPFGCRVLSVESEHSLTLSAPATASVSSADWQLGGSINAKGFVFQFRSGTQNQQMLDGFTAVEVTHSDGSPLRHGNPPWTHLFADPNLDACRIDVLFQRMEEQDPSSGDVHGSSVRIKFFLNGQLVIDDTATGKASSPYPRTYRISFRDFPNQPRTVTVQRITEDSTQQTIQNDTFIQSYTELTDGKLRYSNTALVGFTVDAQQFSNIAARGYHPKGLKVRIPSNYNPVTRLYNETPPWDGSLTSTLFYTDNPAWCFFDLATHTRFGLGNMLNAAFMDKASLYQIAKYCDATNARPGNPDNNYGPTGKHGVPNGKGGWEPRFTCNLYLQRSEDAIKVLQDMAGIFRGMLSYINGVIVPIQDSPADSTTYRMFSPANVMDGRFNYSGVGLRARHNVAIVTWSDLNDTGKIKQEYVEDHEALAKAGAINKLDITGFGCTSRSQARRIGLWAVYAEKLLDDTITFATALEGYFIKPGQVIQIQDPFRAGAQLNGRLVTDAGTSNTHLFLDRSVTLDSGATYTVALINPTTGLLVAKNVTSGAGTMSDITCASFGFASPPEAGSIFQLAKLTPAASALFPELFRVLGVVMKDEAAIEITALKYNASLYDFVDFDHPLVEPPTSNLPPAGNVLPPTHLIVAVIQIIKPDHTIRQDIELAWTASVDRYLSRYRPTWRMNNGNWHGRGGQLDTDVNSYRITNALPGEYEFAIYAINTIGALSDPLHGDDEVVAPPTNITGVSGLQLFGGNHYQNGRAIFQSRDAHFVWNVTAGNGPEIVFGDDPLEVGIPDVMASGFKIEVYNDDQLMWHDDTVSSEYVFAWEMNKQAAERLFGQGANPLRIFRFEVRVKFVDNTYSSPARLTVENPLPPAPLNVTTLVGNGYVSFQWQIPAVPDISHFALFASLDLNDDQPPQVAEFHGTNGTYYPPTTDTYYYWLGTVDSFGSVSANVPQGPPPGGFVRDPYFIPHPGTYQEARHVQIHEETPGCNIRYALTPLNQNPAAFLPYPGGAGVYITGRKRLWAVATTDHPPFESATAQGDYYMDGYNPGPGPQAPVNDNFVNALWMGAGNGSKTGTTIRATHETGEPTGNFSVWYKMNGTGHTRYFRMPNSGSLIATGYTGPDVSHLAVAGSFGGNLLTLPTTQGIVYYIRIRPAGDPGSFIFNFGDTIPVAPPDPSPPINDNFANAINLPGQSGGPYFGTTIDATRETSEPSGSNTVWYKWTCPANGLIVLALIGIESQINAYTGSAVGSLTGVTAVATGPGWIAWNATSGVTYRIRVWKNTDTGNFSLRWRLVVAPPNDNFANAIALADGAGGPISGTTIAATVEGSEPTRSGGPDNTVWYAWVGMTTGIYIGFWPYGDNFVIEVYTGSALGSLTQVATIVQSSGATWWIQTAGTTYWIRVRPATSAGEFHLLWYTPIVSNPSFDPQPGFFNLDVGRRQEIRMVTETPNAHLYWAFGRDPTTSDFDGDTNRNNATLFLGHGTYDLRVFATSPHFIDSGITAGVFTIALSLGPPCPQPQFTPPQGAYLFPLNVVINATEAPTIEVPEVDAFLVKYTTNGQIPSRHGPGTITTPGATVHLTGPCYLKAVVYNRTREESPVEIGNYRRLGTTRPPVFSPGPGEYTAFPVAVTISVPPQTGINIRYTTDGSQPNEIHGTLIASNSGIVSIVIPGTSLRAVAFGDGYITSKVTTGSYTGKITTPTHTPDTSFYSPSSLLSVAVQAFRPDEGPLDPDASIVPVNARYTLDGTQPTRSHGTLLTTFPANVLISGGYRELRTIAFAVDSKSGYDDSDVKLSIYDWVHGSIEIETATERVTTDGDRRVTTDGDRRILA